MRNREQIVEAARELVARDGEAVRMDALATRAGVAVGTLYRHFPAKSDLVDAVVEESTHDLADRAEAAHRRVVAGSAAWPELEGLFAAISDGYSAHRAVTTTAALLELGSSAGPGASAARAVSSAASSGSKPALQYASRPWVALIAAPARSRGRCRGRRRPCPTGAR